jgi:uncharacterized membrane protein YccC
MTGFEMTAIVFGAVTVIVIAALIVVNRKLVARINTLTADYMALEEKFAQSGERQQQELLAIGQRVLEADKMVRRFSERLDAIENNHTPEQLQSQYGQLQNLLQQTHSQQGEASAAEVELLSLLTRQRKLSS